MGKSKFIDKKTAAHYSLICRVTDDQDGRDGAAEPSLNDERAFARLDSGGHASALEDASQRDDRSAYSQSTRTGKVSRARRAELKELGFPDDGYDYLQHCRSIGASGGAGATFVAALAKPQLLDDALIYDARSVAKPAAAASVPRAAAPLVARNPELEAVMAAISCAEEGVVLEEEQAAAGEAEGEAGFGDLEDDFILSVLDAEALPAGSLAEESKGDSDSDSQGTDLDAFDDIEERGEEEEEEEGPTAPGGRASALAAASALERSARAPRHLDDAFEALALEYSDDEIGELDDANPAARGRASLSAFGSVLHAFRASAQGCDALASARAAARADREADEAREPGASADEEEQEERLPGGDGAAEETPEEAAAKEALQVTRLLLGFEPSQRLRTAGDEQLLQRPRAAVPAEEREGWDEPTEMRPCELDLRERDRWDCETIVSTYSNTENRPSVIEAGAPRRAPRAPGSRAAANVGASPALIRLGKTGLPVDFVPHRRTAAPGEPFPGGGDDSASGEEGEDAPGGADWRGATRRKGESAEEKRARKAAVKEGRREARSVKKETKTLFKQEAKATRPQQATGAVRIGASVVPLY